MKRALLLLALTGCTFSQKHPAATIGIVAGTVGFGACWINVEKLGTCSAIGGVAGVGLGGLAALVTWLGASSTTADEAAGEQPLGPLPPADEDRIDTTTEPPPGLPPAPPAGPPGQPTAPPPAGPEAADAPGDAGVPIHDAAHP